MIFGRNKPRQRVLVIEKLGVFSFVISVIFKSYFKIICYRKTTPILTTNKYRRLLDYLDYKWISYLDQDGSLYVKSLPLKFSLTERTFIKLNIKSKVISRILKNYKLDQIGEKKFHTMIKNRLNRNNFDSGVFSIPLIEKLFPKTKYNIIFFPKNYNDYLVLKHLRLPNIKIAGVHALFIGLIKFSCLVGRSLLFKLKSFFVINNKSKISNVDSDNSEINKIINCSIGFFPHENLHYGVHYKKTYLYDNNPNSILYKKNILTFFFGDIDDSSEKYLKNNQIPYISLINYSRNQSLSVLINNIFKIITFKDIINCFLSLEKLFWLTIAIEITTKLEKQIQLLSQFDQLKLIYIHYDVLFPQDFLLACHIKGIETISMQERPIQYLYFPFIFFDHYLINGIGFDKKLKKNGYIYKKSHVVGLPRSTLFNRSEKENLSKYKKIKESYNLVLCFGLSPISDFKVGDYGEDGTSMKSTLLFLDTIYKLSKDFNDSYFIIKFKMNDFLKDIKSHSIIKQINNSINIEIVNNLSEFNSYEIGSLSNIIIGKQTSIMEEALSIGKKVIFYDNEKYLQAYDYPLNKIDIVVSNYDQLKKKFYEIINHDKYLDSIDLKAFNKKYFNNTNAEDSFKLIREKVSGIYNEILSV